MTEFAIEPLFQKCRSGLVAILAGLLCFSTHPGSSAFAQAALADKTDAAPAIDVENSATPAVWVMRDDDSEIWFLGTYHILPPTLDWQSAPVRRAIAAAEEVYLEADIESPAAQGGMLREMISGGFLPRGTYLSEKLTSGQVSALKRICDDLDLSFEAIDVMRPWNAFITLSAQFIVAQGFDPTSGVDSRLALEIKASGRPLRYFETAAQQIKFFTGLPSDIELSLLVTTIDEWDQAADQFYDLFNAWRTGDEQEMDVQINIGMRDVSPEVYDVLLVRRNQAWVRDIEERMAGSGTTLIAVGAGHLVGDQSVIAMLKAKGFSVERVVN